MTIWSGAPFSAAPSKLHSWVLLSWIGIGSFGHSWTTLLTRECNTRIGQPWVPCPPPESERNRLPQHLAWEWRGPVFLRWIGVVFPERRCKQGGKNSQCSLHTPFRAVNPMWSTTSLASDQQLQCLPASERRSLPAQPSAFLLTPDRQSPRIQVQNSGFGKEQISVASETSPTRTPKNLQF